MNMNLEDTIDMMKSEDYILRFKAEYFQTKIRYDRLYKMIIKYEAHTLSFEPKCPIEVYKKQLASMYDYLCILEVRAEIENICI